jgi:hypothetical protein
MDAFPFDINSAWWLAKAGVLILLLLYLAFALIVISQVKLMTKTIKTGYETHLITASYVHLLVIILIILTSLVLL